MKNGKMLLAVFTMLVSSAVYAKAEGINIDFDGNKGAGTFSSDAFKAAAVEAEASYPAVVETPEQVAKGEIIINARMKNGAKITEEKLSCKPGQGADKVGECRKSDSTALTIKDVNALSLRAYYSEETLKFADLMSQNKHSYTNQSGPMTFSCEDSCASYVSVSPCLGPICVSVPLTCEEWSHSCTCVAGCD